MAPKFLRAEIVIIGAGYAGLNAALSLAEAGRDVVLVDAQPIGGNDVPLPGRNQSSISGGHVTYGFSQDYPKLARRYGHNFAKKLFCLSLSGIDKVEENCRQYNIKDAAFRRGYLTLARNARDEAALIDILNETQIYGDLIEGERIIGARETTQFISSPEFQCSSIYSKHHGQIEPQAYIHGLAQAARNHGVRIFDRTRIKNFRIFSHGVSAVTNEGDAFIGQRMIVSGGTGILRGGHFPVMRAYQATVGNYAVKTEPLPAAVVKQIFPQGYPGAFADMRRADVLYARLDKDNCLDFGAYSFAGRRPNAKDVEKLLYQTFPQLREAGICIAAQRYGFLAGTRQEIVQIFQSDSTGNVFPVRIYNADSRLTILSAFAAEGINLGTTAGQAVADAIMGDASDFNTLAYIQHPRMPVTFPWEGANRVRDYFLATLLSYTDRMASKRGLAGVFARAAADFV